MTQKERKKDIWEEWNGQRMIRYLDDEMISFTRLVFAASPAPILPHPQNLVLSLAAKAVEQATLEVVVGNMMIRQTGTPKLVTLRPEASRMTVRPCLDTVCRPVVSVAQQQLQRPPRPADSTDRREELHHLGRATLRTAVHRIIFETPLSYWIQQVIPILRLSVVSISFCEQSKSIVTISC